MSKNIMLESKGPFFHRFLVGFFSIVVAVLVYWLLGFVMEDIDNLPITPLEEVQKRFVSEPQVKESAELQKQIDVINRTVGDHQQKLNLVHNSMGSFQNAMNQLLEIQKLSVQKGVAMSEAEQKGMTELFQTSRESFLANQKKEQELNEEMTRLKDEELGLQKKKRGIDDLLQKQKDQADQEYRVIQRRHEWGIAALKLLVLIPIIVTVVFVFIKKRAGIYAPLVYAVGIPVLLKVGWILHDYFPDRYFKYILLFVSIGVIVRVVIYLLRMIVSPKKQWLLKQYREAYERFLCPVCAYPIRRGPFKYLFWNRRTVKKLRLLPPSDSHADEPYSCPTCSTKLYEKCAVCNGVRHSLLPACEKCGAEKELTLT